MLLGGGQKPARTARPGPVAEPELDLDSHRLEPDRHLGVAEDAARIDVAGDDHHQPVERDPMAGGDQPDGGIEACRDGGAEQVARPHVIVGAADRPLERTGDSSSPFQPDTHRPAMRLALTFEASVQARWVTHADSGARS